MSFLDDDIDPEFMTRMAFGNGAPNMQSYREIGELPNLTFVYFIQSGDFIKIGWSKHPEKRVDQIRRGGKATRPSAGLVEDPTLLAYIPGTTKDESSLHARFASSRDQGEWFVRTPELDALIEEAAASQATWEVDALLRRHQKRVAEGRCTPAPCSRERLIELQLKLNAGVLDRLDYSSEVYA